MTEIALEASWVLEGIGNLVQLKQELWLTETDIVIIDHGIAAMNRLFAEFTANDSNTPLPIPQGTNFA